MRNRHKFLVIAIAPLAILMLMSGRTGADSIEIRRATAASRQAFQLIDTLHTVMEVDAKAMTFQLNGKKTSVGESGKHTVEYWVTPDFVRYRETLGRQTTDSVVAKGVRKSVTRSSMLPNPYGNIFSNDSGAVSDLWVLSGFATHYQSRFLFDILENNRSADSVTIKHDSEKLTHVALRLDNGVQLDIWQSDKHNGISTKQRYSRPASSAEFTVELETSQLKEYAAGIFFPERAEKRVYIGGQLAARLEITFRDTTVNQPIRVDGNLEMPAGIFVNDHINRTIFQADARGNPVSGSVTPFPDKQVTPTEKPSVQSTAPRSMRWLYWGAAAVLLAVIVATPRLWRKRNRNKV